MDCKTARLLLEFAQPRAGEMDPADLAALEQHFAGCPECDALARAERGLDHAFSKAMQAVEVPSGLRGRLLDRLDRERGDVSLRRFGRAARAAAAVAAVLLAAWGIYAWRQAHLPAVDMDRAWEDLLAEHAAPPGREDLTAHFRKLGFDGELPDDLKYTSLAYYGMGEFQGRPVPQLVFVSQQGNGRARVRLLSPKQFNLATLPVGFQSPDGYDYRLSLWRAPGCAEIVDYTGSNANWLRQD
jgi:hypothetical protein